MQKFAVIILLTLLCNLDSRSTPVSTNLVTERNAVYSYAYIRINTLDLTSNYKGSGGTSGIVYVMKKAD